MPYNIDHPVIWRNLPEDPEINKIFAVILTTQFRDVFSSDSDCQPSLARNLQCPDQIPPLQLLMGLLHTASKAVAENTKTSYEILEIPKYKWNQQ